MHYFLRKVKLSYAIIISFLLITGCKKFIEVQAPITSVNGENVFNNDANAIGVLTGIYIKMGVENQNILFLGTGLPLISVYCSLSADELVLNSISANPTLQGYFKNELTSQNIGDPDFWRRIYGYIYVLNSAINGLNKSTTLTPTVKRQLLGEACFLRAFYYFYLTNLYGNIVVTTETDYAKTSLLARSSVEEAYNLIKRDLLQAQELLDDKYFNGDLSTESQERTRPNKAAATALLARVYLYLEDWDNAEIESSKVISKNEMYQILSLNDAFKKNSLETIWATQPVGSGTSQNTGEGKLFVLTPSGLTSLRPFYLNQDLLTAFEPNDQRLSSWVRTSTFDTLNIYQAYKYKIGSTNTATVEYPIILRFAEQYLIRAEARAHQNNITGAVNDLNIIRTRARGDADPSVLPNLSVSISQTETLTAIAHERQVELFTEWGHRWFDLKRTKTVDSVMATATIKKGGTWNSTDAYYPITGAEILSAPNIVQTPGY
jgi:starch-binding outer membrane protein, SusD/RagB family